MRARRAAELPRLGGFGQPLEELPDLAPVAQGLGEVAHADPFGRTPAPARGLQRLPRARPVVGEERRTFVELARIQVRDDACDRRVHPRPTLGELRPVCHLLGERMLEGVLRLRMESALVDEFRRHQRMQRGHQLRLGKLDDAFEDGLGELLANHRGRLEDRLLALSEAIDPGRQHRLHGGRDGHLVHGPGEPVRASRAVEHPALDERLDRLLDEERVAAGARADVVRQPRERGVGSEEIPEQLGARRLAQRRQRQLLVVGPLHPAGVVLGAEGHEQERPAPR